MKLRYLGHSCFQLTFADGTVLICDPFDPSVSYPPVRGRCTAALLSHDHFDHNYTGGLEGDFAVIRTPGAHRVGGVCITGIPAFHDEVQGAKRGQNILFRIEGDGLRLAHLGDIGHPLDEKQQAALADLDVLLLPIGGNYTIDAAQALRIIDALKPRLSIAMHYRTDAFDIAIARPDEFITLSNAQALPHEITLTPQTITDFPRVAYMNYR